MPGKSGFYEQVIHVKGFSVFLSWRLSLSCCFVVVGPHVVLHRVSIRTLSEPLVALCRLGSEGMSAGVKIGHRTPWERRFAAE